MKRFVVDRHGRIVFPFNFFPALDVSVFEGLDQFEAVIRRDFADKARTQAEIVTRLDTGGYAFPIPMARVARCSMSSSWSSASIPLALQDAVRDGVLTRPMRIFAPGFGAGAVGGYIVARIGPGIVA